MKREIYLMVGGGRRFVFLNWPEVPQVGDTIRPDVGGVFVVLDREFRPTEDVLAIRLHCVEIE